MMDLPCDEDEDEVVPVPAVAVDTPAIKKAEWMKAFDEPDPEAEAAAAAAAAAARAGSDDDDDLRKAAPSQAQGATAATATTATAVPPAPAFKKVSDFRDTPAGEEQHARRGRNFIPGVDKGPSPNSAAAQAEEEEEEARREPLPELPNQGGVMSIDEAYAFLGVAREDRGSLEKLKTRFRKMCLKWHPDKNRGREKRAAEVFQVVHAAYHFLTTTNFDYKRWKKSFTVPPMQSLDEVLMMAISGEDPYEIEALLRKRGEYRPHRDFGINLSIPWVAGGVEDPSYDVAAGSAYTTTQALDGRDEVRELGHDEARGARGGGGSGAGDGGAGGASGGAGGSAGGEGGERPPVDDEAYAATISDLVRRGADLAKLRRMVGEGGGGSELQMELRRLGLTRLGERQRAVGAIKAAAAGRAAKAPDGGRGALVVQATGNALLHELAVVEAPRVRELGLYHGHNELFIERFGEQARFGGNDDERPWEATAVGREVKAPYRAPYVRAKTYPSVSPLSDPGRAAELAELANEQAMTGYRAKNWELCYDASTEAIRLNPQKFAYYGNRAAAALKLRGQTHLRQAVDDCKMAVYLNPAYVKGYTRSAEAHFAMGEVHTVRMAIELYEQALKLDPTNRAIQHALENVRMVYSSDYA